MSNKDSSPPLRVGVIGSGFVSRHFAYEVERRSGYAVTRVLTRRPLDSCHEFPRQEALTDSLDALIEGSDVVFECTGDALYAAETVGRILETGTPVVTLNSEFHVTVGSHFVERGLLSESEGDQPGSQAALHEDAVAVGLTPLVYSNMKAFLNRSPQPEEMAYWAKRQNYSLEMVTAFTDNTKLQIEQCLVANGLGAGIAQEDLIGPETGDIQEGATILAESAEKLGYPISDYILDRNLPHGVFVVGRHDERQAVALRNLKMGEGPYYTLKKDYCLVHLEVFKTIDRIARERRVLLNNSAIPRISVASVAKRQLNPGDYIERGCGSFDLRGTCVDIIDRPGHLPICLACKLHIRRKIEPGQVLTFDDIELPESQALDAWRAIEGRVLATRVSSTAQVS